MKSTCLAFAASRRIDHAARIVAAAVLGAVPAFAQTQAPALPTAPPDPGGRATAVAPAPAATDGLEVMLDVHGIDRFSSSRFASLQDAKLWMRLRNSSKKEELIAVDEESRRFMAASLLLDLEITRDDGQPLALPGMHCGTSFDPLDGRNDLLFQVPVRWLAPGSSFDWTIPIAGLPGWQSVELEPGTYRLRVIVHGPPDPGGIRYSDAGAVRAWRGRAVSATLRFEITGAAQQLEFGPPESGLRFAPRPDPFVRRWRSGESVPMQFLVENVTDAPIEVTRVLGGSQEDESSVQGEDGGERIRGRSMGTGWDAVVTLTLPPHGRARLYAWPLSIGERGVQACGWGEGPAPPGRYAIRHKLALTVGDPAPVNHVIPDRKFFDVPPRTVEFFAAR